MEREIVGLIGCFEVVAQCKLRRSLQVGACACYFAQSFPHANSVLIHRVDRPHITLLQQDSPDWMQTIIERRRL